MTESRRGRAQHGFTLVELLVSMMAGLVVVAAAFALVSFSARASGGVNDRVDATQTARIGLGLAAQRLRAIACPEGQPPIQSIVKAHPSYVYFHADLDSDQTFDPDMHRISVVPSAANAYTLEASEWVGLRSSTVPSTPPTTTTTLAEQTNGFGSAKRVFEYFVVGETLPLEPQPALGYQVDPAQLARVARIDIAFGGQSRTRTADEVDPVKVPIVTSVYAPSGRNGSTAPPTFGC